MATLFLFGAGIILGAGTQWLTSAAPAQNPYSSLPPMAEPQTSADVATAIRTDDARALSRLVTNQDLLNKLHSSLDPIIAVSDVKFLGAADRTGMTLSAYVVRGRDQQGNKIIRGFVLSVQHGEVVGVN
ncbi:MAG: hypothetical protein AUH85_05935 [Chloroflexi bacterium 13_1_40CM_4_68_4]|nr:MAG: hypothetical protein AUH85_05935 [Chloroflexi bacterium 13_1_40CM_4_68_4]